MLTSLPLFAETTTETTLEIVRTQDWTSSGVILLGAVCVAVAVFVILMYIRDSAELKPAIGWLLTGLRVAAFLALLVLYLEPQWRMEETRIRNSRVFLLVDTSNSMTFGADSPMPHPGEDTRSERVVKALQQSDLIQRLRRKHDVFVLSFDRDLRRLHTFPMLTEEVESGGGAGAAMAAEIAGPQSGSQGEQSQATLPADLDWSKLLSPVGKESRIGDAIRAIVEEEQSPAPAGIIVFSDFVVNQGGDPRAAAELAGEARVPVYPVGLGSNERPANVRVSELLVQPKVYAHDEFPVTGYLQAFGLRGTTLTAELLARPAGGTDAAAKPGTGKVIRKANVTFAEEGKPVAVKFTLKPSEAFELGDEGTGKQTLCLRVKYEDAVPDDNFDEAEIEVVKEQLRVLLLAGGPTRDYRFLRTMLHGGVVNEEGGAEERPMLVDVLLQTAQAGISQEADEILDGFPETPAALEKYHCIVAFDPNWEDDRLGLADYQAEMLKDWVDRGGGLIVVAGPVYTRTSVAAAVHDRNTEKVRDLVQILYPVRFADDFMMFGADQMDTTKPRRLLFTREGTRAGFLWLTNEPETSEAVWSEFCGDEDEPGGVYAYYPVEGAKKGATVYARVEAPETGAKEEDQPPFFVGQTYGSGRVFYIGSGEMWRLRKIDPKYFATFYTKLIRHVAQGRLTRGSKRGALLVDVARYVVGDNVDLRVRLTNEQFGPSEAEDVLMQVIYQDGTARSLTLASDPATPGSFVGQFRPTREGKYRLEVPIPNSDADRLVKTIHVQPPRGEQEDPRRNDELLVDIAKRSQRPRDKNPVAAAPGNPGGTAARGPRWYFGDERTVTSGGLDELADVIQQRKVKRFLPISPSEEWEKRYLLWMMCIACGLLCSEWLVRRLARLA